jgi:meiotic recombination protein SPO11
MMRSPGHALWKLSKDIELEKLTFALATFAGDRERASAGSQGGGSQSRGPVAASEIVERIDELVASIAHEWLSLGKEGEKHEVKLEVRRAKARFSSARGGFDALGDEETEGTSTLSLHRQQNRLPFARILRVLTIVRPLLVEGNTMTRRDLFYVDVKLFRKQWASDRALDDTASLLRVQRNDLNVYPAACGKVCGPLSFSVGRRWLDCSRSTTMIPGNLSFSDLQIRLYDPTFVLIVEKDAIFCRLVDDGFHMRHNALILTGIGYPDVSTRLLVHTIAAASNVPILALTDGDPAGLHIAATYAHGSENLRNVPNLAVPTIRWLGVHRADVEAARVTENELLPFTAADRSKIRFLQSHGGIMSRPAWYAELTRMHEAKTKLELEAIGGVDSTYLSRVYLPRKLEEGGWI